MSYAAAQVATLLKLCALQLCFSDAGKRKPEIHFHASVCSRAIIVITDPADLLLPAVKCLWENKIEFVKRILSFIV